VQLEEIDAQWRVEDDWNGENERNEEAVAHVSFHGTRHGWITHVMARHLMVHYAHIHLRGGLRRRMMFHCGRSHIRLSSIGCRWP